MGGGEGWKVPSGIFNQWLYTGVSENQIDLNSAINKAEHVGCLSAADDTAVYYRTNPFTRLASTPLPLWIVWKLYACSHDPCALPPPHLISLTRAALAQHARDRFPVMQRQLVHWTKNWSVSRSIRRSASYLQSHQYTLQFYTVSPVNWVSF